MAVADQIVTTVQSVAQAQSEFQEEVPPSKEGAEHAMIAMIERMFSFFVTRPEAGEIVPFVLREMAAPSPAFDRVYQGMIEPLHIRGCRLWEAATGEPAGSEETRINVFLFIGQILYFRLAREAVRRRMGWDEIDSGHGTAIAKIAIANLRTLLAAKEGRTS